MPMQNKFVEIRKIARELPHSPGVYLMKDRLGSVIYVGKAKDLRKRVGSYFPRFTQVCLVSAQNWSDGGNG